MDMLRKSVALRILENVPLGFDPLVVAVLFKAWQD
jgi:hypothetical protein